MSARWRVWHRTRYTYDDDVTDSLGLGWLAPRPLPWQAVADHRLEVDPEPRDLSADVDSWGNATHYFQVTTGHRVLTVTSTAEVAVEAERHDTAALATPWERCRPAERPDVAGAWEAVGLTLPSPLIAPVPAATAYAAGSLPPGRPVGEAVRDLVGRIHSDFDYHAGATSVTSTVADALEARAGVCQDFAHLAIAGLRAHGLAARYVSGYLATEPPPGRERVFGADASHAWLAVWLPDGSWLAVDPTNDQVVADRHVTVAWGRDYADVPPLKGVIFSEASSSRMTVEVDVAPVREPARSDPGRREPIPGPPGLRGESKRGGGHRRGPG